MVYYKPSECVVTINGEVVEGFADEVDSKMWEHPAMKKYEDNRAAEEKRIKKIANPAERARQYAWFDQNSKEELRKITMLINNRESTTADLFEELKYVR